VDEPVAEAADAVVELHDHVPHLGPLLADRADRVDDVPQRVHALEANRVRHALLAEDPAAAGLRPVRRERRVHPEDGKTEPRRQLDLVRRGGERDDHPEVRIDDETADPLEHARVAEKLLRERRGAAVGERDEREPAARLCGVELGDEPEPVLDQSRQDRLGGHVDHA
jgi:hypothetical protein